MKKFKFLLLIVLLGLILVTGCKEPTLEDAMEELDEKSATVNCDLKMDITLTYNGESQTMSQSINMKVEQDGDKTYAINYAQDVEQHLYSKQVGDYVKSYTKTDGEWELATTDSVDQMTDELLDIDVEETFTNVDGIWVGNTEALTEQLSDYMEEFASDSLGLSGVNIDETSVSKYDITMVDGHISKIDIAMKIVMSANGGIVEINVEMPMEFSKIGETKVIEPEGLPVE